MLDGQITIRNEQDSTFQSGTETIPANLAQPEVRVVVSFAAFTGLRRTCRGWTCEPEPPTRCAWDNPFWPAVLARRRAGPTNSAVGLR